MKEPHIKKEISDFPNQPICQLWLFWSSVASREPHIVHYWRSPNHGEALQGANIQRKTSQHQASDGPNPYGLLNHSECSCTAPSLIRFQTHLHTGMVVEACGVV